MSHETHDAAWDDRRRAILEAAEARAGKKPRADATPRDLAKLTPITVPDPIALGFKIGIGIFLANLLLGGILTLIVYACWAGR